MRQGGKQQGRQQRQHGGVDGLARERAPRAEEAAAGGVRVRGRRYSGWCGDSTVCGFVSPTGEGSGGGGGHVCMDRVRQGQLATENDHGGWVHGG